LNNKIGLQFSPNFSSSNCSVCPLTKFRRLSFPNSNNLFDLPFDLLHCDIWGPYAHPTYEGKRFFITLVDECSRFTWLFLLKHKSEASIYVKQFFTMVQTQFGVSIKCLRYDNAKELALIEFLASIGTLHQFSCVERPEQNLVVERKHQHLLNVARALYFQSIVPISFWGDCVTTATFLINRTLSPLLKHNSPFNILFKKGLDYHALRIFGCLAFASTLPSSRNKFSPRAVPAVFVCYPKGYKGYKLYSLDTKKFFVSRDVVFHESIFPFQTISQNQVIPDSLLDLVVPIPLMNTLPNPDQNTSQPTQTSVSSI